MSRAKTSEPQLTRREPAAPERERWLRMYRQMLRIRLFEEQVNDLYKTARMPDGPYARAGAPV